MSAQHGNRLIYMDNAATSHPKPPQVIRAMLDFMEHVGANPGRSRHHRSRQALDLLYETRQALARLFNGADPSRIVFTLNATEALNVAILGVISPGDHIVMTQMEHNSVIRPVRHLERQGQASVSIAQCDKMGHCDLDALHGLIRKETSLVIVNHASNVCGTIQDIKAIRELAPDAILLVDAAQTAGSVEIDVQSASIDLLAFAGHKGLLGPQGTGGLYVRPGLSLRPLKRGGTGTHSEQPEQPSQFPDLLESGTLNNVGIAGLGAGVRFILEHGVQRIREHEKELCKAFVDGLKSVAGLTLYGPLKPDEQVPVVSLTFDAALPDGLHLSFGGCGGRSIPATFESVHPQEAGTLLSDRFDISVRVGLHCAPLAHQALGTFPDGTVRFSFGFFNTLDEVHVAVRAVKEIADKLDLFDDDETPFG